MAVSIRGTGLITAVNSSHTVPWPTGTAANDFAIIFIGNAWTLTVPTGWTANYNFQSASQWNAAVLSKTLTAADITAGSVVISFSGSFDDVIAILTTIGNTTIKKLDVARNDTGSTSITVTSTGTVTTNDLLVYFGSNRGASTDTVNRGTLQRQGTTGGSGSGCLYTEASLSSAPTAIFNYSVAGTGNFEAIADLGDPPAPTASMIIAPIVSASGSQHQIVTAPKMPT